MIAVEHVDGPVWAIRSTAYSKVLNQEAKRTPGMTWIGATRSWEGYSDAVHVTAKRAAARGLRIQGCIDFEPSGLLVAKKGLRNYQHPGVDFLIAKASEGCILADELGLGKSAQAVTAARALRQKTVIVCQSFVRGVWLDFPDGELAKWWPAAHVSGLLGTKPDLQTLVETKEYPAADVAVLHYDILHAWVETLIAWGARTLILDEGHCLVGHEARRSKAAKRLAATCSHRIMLTGTPIENRVRQFWGPVDVVSPGRFGKKFFKFGLRYCDGHEEQIDFREEGIKVERRVWKFDGASNIDELRERVTWSPETPWGFVLRRRKSDVDLELPARQRQIVTMEVPARFSAPLHSIRSDKLIRQALGMAADGKFPEVVEMALDHLHAGNRVVVASFRRRVADSIAAAIRRKFRGKVEVSHGQIPFPRRAAIIKRKPACLCVTLDSTKGGINLSDWNVALVAELTHSATTLRQFEGRFAREAGKSAIIQYCIARGTADDMIKRMVLEKLDVSQEVFGKNDDALDVDLRGSADDKVERMRKLYEAIMAEDAA